MKTALVLLTVVAGLSAERANAALVSVINPLNRTISGGTTTGGNFISLADLQTVISTRANTVKAGVFDAEGTTAAGNITSAEPDYAVPDFTITGATRYGRTDAGAVGSQSSGSRFGLVSTTETWTLSADVSGEVVTHFGVVFGQWRIGADVTSVVATFTDNTTATYTSTVAGPTSNTVPVAITWEFAGFVAPAGKGIKSITVNEVSTGDWVAFDDMAFAVAAVPEPGVASLALAAAGCFLRRRRTV